MRHTNEKTDRLFTFTERIVGIALGLALGATMIATPVFAVEWLQAEDVAVEQKAEETAKADDAATKSDDTTKSDTTKSDTTKSDTTKSKGGARQDEDLEGLTDAEREEYNALREKRRQLGEGEHLSDADKKRMKELKEKAFLAKMEATLSADEYTEFKKLYDKDAAAQDKVDEILESEGLTDEEQTRYDELESKVYGDRHGRHGGRGDHGGRGGSGKPSKGAASSSSQDSSASTDSSAKDDTSDSQAKA